MPDKLPKSHLSRIRAILRERDRSHAQGIAVSHVPPLMSRGEGTDIFTEGEGFSGVEEQGMASATLTAIAAPHVPATIPNAAFCAAAEKAFGRKINLPAGLKSTDRLAPQLLLWWQLKDHQNTTTPDLSELYTLPSPEQHDIILVLNIQTMKAFAFFENLSEIPAITGSWGFAKEDERRHLGLGRGIPSVKQGHIHICSLTNLGKDVALDSRLSASDKIRHFQPWEALVQGKFGGKFIGVIESICLSTLLQQPFVSPVSEYRSHADGRSSALYGFDIQFPNRAPLPEIYRFVITMAGKFDALQTSLLNLYSIFWKNQNSSEVMKSTTDKMIAGLQLFGIDPDTSSQAADFILKIRPTYAQLTRWLEELSQGNFTDVSLQASRNSIDDLMKKYAAAARSNRRGAGIDTLTNTLISETTSPGTEVKEHTWAQKSSGLFVIEKPDRHDGVITVQGLKIFFGVASTEGGFERIAGALLRRTAKT